MLDSSNTKRATLLFRKGAKTIYRVFIIRKTGYYLVRFTGGDPAEIVRAMRICRDHFDRWFGIEAADIVDIEPNLDTDDESQSSLSDT